MIVIVCCFAGCVEGRSSTHELEHVVPAHWPASLQDAADKIEARLAAIEAQASNGAQARAELAEIVSWLPEVAADTAMREPNWNTIHAACQSIEAMMKRSDDWKQAGEQLRALCVKLREMQGLAEEA